MGCRGAVDLVRNVVRNLVFSEAKVPRCIEVSKGESFPEGPGYAFVILESLDLVRYMGKRIVGILEGTDSEHHKWFAAACATHNLSPTRQGGCGEAPAGPCKEDPLGFCTC